MDNGLLKENELDLVRREEGRLIMICWPDTLLVADGWPWWRGWACYQRPGQRGGARALLLPAGFRPLIGGGQRCLDLSLSGRWVRTGSRFGLPRRFTACLRAVAEKVAVLA